jgi:DNA-directed RNA polymerase specialized sigma24 family protein
MSPLSLRRHRAERLLREEFEALRGRVLASVRGRLRASGVSLDQDDLEACYATAWQGLYAAVLDGQEIANPTGWLVLVTFRRAIEEQRARVRARADVGMETAGAVETDFAAELDDRIRVRQLFEGLRGRLDGREREAATLCYLQGLSRSEAAAQMGVSEARMRKLMEGRGPGRPGVAGKVGALVASIRDGEWCEEQGSLMRALAYGILDPDGERYQLALMHHGQCPACRAYVTSLRGLAAALPPVLLPWGVGVAALVRAGEGLHAAAATGGAGSAGRATAGGVGGAGAVSASGAAGAGGVAGGGWLVGAGPLGAKLAVGCLLALGVGAGCIAMGPAPAHVHHHASRRLAVDTRRRTATAEQPGSPTGGVDGSLAVAASGSVRSFTPLASAARASREFGPEQTPGASAPRSLRPDAHLAPAARLAYISSTRTASDAASAGAGRSQSSSQPSAANSPASSGDRTPAEREFSPG